MLRRIRSLLRLPSQHVLYLTYLLACGVALAATVAPTFAQSSCPGPCNWGQPPEGACVTICNSYNTDEHYYFDFNCDYGGSYCCKTGICWLIDGTGNPNCGRISTCWNEDIGECVDSGWCSTL